MRTIEVFFHRCSTQSRLSLGEFDVPASWEVGDMVAFYEAMNADLVADGWIFGFKYIERCEGV